MHKGGKKKGAKVSFDEEIVTKDSAKVLLSEVNTKEDKKSNENIHENTTRECDSTNNTKLNRKRKKQKDKTAKENPTNIKTDSDHKIPKKKKKKDKVHDETIKSGDQETNDNNLEQSESPKKEESIRAKKRKRHAQLLEEKKLKTELELQQKSLNYISQWKHNKNFWKFEKLRQVWLQQNLFDDKKIPDEFWETVLDYFKGSKGHAREVILKEAINIIDKVVDGEEEETKHKRARDLVQNLQE